MKKASIQSPNNAYVLKSGLCIALEDYRVEEDIVLADGTVIKAGTRFFNLSDLRQLEEAGAFPEGYDIPTAEELRDITNEFGTVGGCRSPQYLKESLGLDAKGSLLNPASYVSYKNDPSDESPDIVGVGFIGSYLCVDEGGSAAMLFIDRLSGDDNFCVNRCNPDATGSVRLVNRSQLNEPTSDRR